MSPWMDWHYSHWEGEVGPIYPSHDGNREVCAKSGFNQLVPVSGFFVENPQVDVAHVE